MLTIDVPGKLFIAGEYAVTRKGGLALVAAIKTDFSVTISKSDGGLSHLSTNIGLPPLAFALTGIEISADSPWRFALTALQQMATCFQLTEAIDLHIQSGLGFGKEKLGYGSSAAVVVGVVQAVAEFFNLGLTSQEIFDVTGDVHFQVQGSGSMGDVAAISHGGSIFYRNADLIKTVSLPFDSYVARTHLSASTHEKLSLSLSGSFYDQSDTIVEKLATTQDFDKFKTLLLENQQLLIDNLPADYVTPELASALEIINKLPDFMAKISGAGFGENLIVFATKGTDTQQLTAALAAADVTLEKIEIADIYDERTTSTSQG